MPAENSSLSALLSLAVSTVTISVPYGCAALGGTLSERGGTTNIALEGTMLVGAFTFVLASWGMATHGWLGVPATLVPWAALAVAVAAGAAISAVHAVATAVFRANQIVSGFALNLLALGLTQLLLVKVFGSASNSPECPTLHAMRAPAEAWWAVLAPLTHPLLAVAAALFAGAHLLIYRTRFGLRLRACGENPAAADSLGVSVRNYRVAGTVLGGLVAAVGGVWLSAGQGRYVSELTNGRGYIGLAVMIIGRWSPAGAAGACLVFGFADALQNRMQLLAQQQGAAVPDGLAWLAALARALPTQGVQALPYVLTLVLIAGFVGRSVPPAAVGQPFVRSGGKQD